MHPFFIYISQTQIESSYMVEKIGKVPEIIYDPFQEPPPSKLEITAMSKSLCQTGFLSI